MNIRLPILLLLLAAPLSASYVAMTFGEDLLLSTVSGEQTLFFPVPCFMDRKLDARLDGTALFFGERVMSFDNPVSLHNSYSVFDLRSAVVAFRPLPLLAFSVSLVPWKTFDYKAAYHFPAGAAVFDGTRTLGSAGSVRALRLSAVCHILGSFAVGATGGLLFGGRTVRSSEKWTSATNLDWTETNKAVYSGWEAGLHAAVEIRKTLRILAFVSLPVTLTEPDGGDSRNYPLSLGLRMTVAVLNPADARFYAEGRWSPTGDLTVTSASVTSTPYGSSDTFSFLVGARIGVKTAGRVIPVRLGYAWLPYFNNYFADRNVVFAGFDISLGRGFGLAVDAEYSKRNWRGDNVFYENDKLIDETVFTVKAGLTWTLQEDRR